MKLLKTLYGLKQAPREWFLMVKDFFESLGLKSADSDPNLFVGKGVYILLFVDDMLIVGDKTACSITKAKIMKRWKCKELIGELFVGFQIDRNRKRRSIKIHQTFYTTKLLERLRMDKSNPATLPIPAGTVVRTDKSDVPLGDDDSFIYSQIVGSTIYLSNGTRPDIAYAVGQLASVMAKPFTTHLQLTKQLLRYLNGTRTTGIVYSSHQNHFNSFTGLPIRRLYDIFTDVTWATEQDRKSVGGVAAVRYGGVFTWQSQK